MPAISTGTTTWRLPARSNESECRLKLNISQSLTILTRFWAEFRLLGHMKISDLQDHVNNLLISYSFYRHSADSHYESGKPQSRLLRKRNALRARIPEPKTASAIISRQRDSTPTPLRKIPRTICMK
jgi:hypothetical protein